MGENLYICPLNVKALKSLIGNDQLGKVIVLLKKWVDSNGSSYENEIIELKRKYREMRELERNDILPVEKTLQIKAKISVSLLKLLDDIDAEEEENHIFGLEGNI